MKPLSEILKEAEVVKKTGKRKAILYERTRIWKKNNREKIREYDKRRWAENAGGIKQYRSNYHKKWREKNGYKDVDVKKFPEKYKARYLLRHAVESGKIKRKKCFCGEIKTEAHHPDYSKPYLVVWFCRKHHIEHHKKHEINSRSIKSRRNT